MNRWHLLSAVAIAPLAIALSSSNAWSWNSGPEDNVGPASAQEVWSAALPPTGKPRNEHAELLQKAFVAAGLPTGLVGNLNVFAMDKVAVPGTTLKSVEPAPFDQANAIQSRTYDVVGFAGLPDHSYSLLDWAQGNEKCPDDTLGIYAKSVFDAIGCHEFAFHMGSLNSTHFLPQARIMYREYHGLALKRAGECEKMENDLGKLPASRKADADELIKECEREALSLEAVGQHYLQDAWAVGHMWERWGYPTFSAFAPSNQTRTPGDTATPEQQYRAFAVSTVAGLIHGAESVLDLSILNVPLLKNVPDQMSGGDVWWKPDAMSSVQDGIGDFHVDALATGKYAVQGAGLLKCSAAGVYNVYAATAKVSGQIGRSTPILSERDLDEQCFTQRATNLAIWKGFGISCPDPTNTACATAGTLVKIALSSKLAGRSILQLTKSQTDNNPAMVSVANQTSDEFRRQFTKLSANVWTLGSPFQLAGLLGILGTDLAETGLLLNTLPNGFFGVQRNGVTTAPAPYADKDDDRLALKRAFNRSYAREWCASQETQPSRLKARLANASPTELAAAQEICIQFAARHARIDGNASLCDALGTNVADVHGSGTARDVATAYCKGESPVVIKVTNTSSSWTGLPATVVVSGFVTQNWVTFPFQGTLGNTCSGERGSPLFSPSVDIGASFFGAQTISGLPTQVGAGSVNRRPCSSFFAYKNDGLGNPKVWVNATGRSVFGFGGPVADWEYQLRYYSGDPPSYNNQKCELGTVPNAGFFSGIPMQCQIQCHPAFKNLPGCTPAP